MKVIYKYPFDEIISMPKGAKILTVNYQERPDSIFKFGLYLWAEVDTDMPMEERRFKTYGTGWEMDKFKKEYIGTVHVNGYVWHMYEYVH